MPAAEETQDSAGLKALYYLLHPVSGSFDWGRTRHRQSPFVRAEFLLSRPSADRMRVESG